MRIFRKRVWIRLGVRRRGGLTAFTILAVIFLTLLMGSAKFHRLLLDMAEAKVKYQTMQLVNETLSAVMTEPGNRFDPLIVTEKDAGGIVRSVRADAAKLNLLQATLSEKILSRWHEEQRPEVQVPLTNLLGLTMWSGIGPTVSVRVIPLSEVEIAFHDSLEQAGINQTKMQMMMNVSIRVGIMAPNLQRTAEIQTSVPVAQMVIVGEVPNSYTQIAGSEQNAADIALETEP